MTPNNFNFWIHLLWHSEEKNSEFAFVMGLVIESTLYGAKKNSVKSGLRQNLIKTHKSPAFLKNVFTFGTYVRPHEKLM